MHTGIVNFDVFTSTRSHHTKDREKPAAIEDQTGLAQRFTMLYIAVLESKGKDHWDQCCHTISREDVSPQALQLIPPQLLTRLGFQDRESEELCRSVDRFYTELFNMHTHGNDTSALSRQAPSMRKRKRE